MEGVVFRVPQAEARWDPLGGAVTKPGRPTSPTPRY